MNPEQRTKLPAVAFRGYVQRYREPALVEGFSDMTKVDFRLEGTDEQRALWSKYWIS